MHDPLSVETPRPSLWCRRTAASACHEILLKQPYIKKMIIHFIQWLHQRQRKQQDYVPEPDKVMPLIAQAGARGMTRSQVGKVIDLDRDTLSASLDGLLPFSLCGAAIRLRSAATDR